ncbi:MAG: helix-turn-helix domain-containing protein [Streptosporangiaceae bacterium]
MSAPGTSKMEPHKAAVDEIIRGAMDASLPDLTEKVRAGIGIDGLQRATISSYVSARRRALQAAADGTAGFLAEFRGCLQAARRARRLSLADVSALSGGRLRPGAVGSYERGDRDITMSHLAALAALYGVPVASLIPGPREEGEP